MKHPFPKFIGGKHTVRGVAVLEKGLKKQGQEPVGSKKRKYDQHKNELISNGKLPWPNGMVWNE